MSVFKDHKLSIPKSWGPDWDKALSAATGIDRELLVTRKKGSQLLSRIDEIRVTPERLGWLNLWAKVFAALNAVSSALSSHSNLILQLVYKNTFELMLQVHTVLDPVFNLQKKSGSDIGNLESKHLEEFSFRSTIDRLRAYLAYCLWHDKAYYEEMINPRSFKEVWNFSPPPSLTAATSMSKQYGYYLDKWEPLFSSQDTDDRKRQVRQAITRKIRLIEEWLADPDLRRWASEMEAARTRLKGGVPFFAMFDKSDRSIPRRLIKEGLRFGYASYVMSSMMSHASSMDGFVQIEKATASVLLHSDDSKNEIERVSVDLIFRCKYLFILLETIQERILSRKELRNL